MRSTPPKRNFSRSHGILSMRRLAVLSGLLILAAPTPATAQDAKSGKVADSSAGRAGQRQMRTDEVAGMEPLLKIRNRIQNRVQSRVRNRIDRHYDPAMNETTDGVPRQ